MRFPNLKYFLPLNKKQPEMEQRTEVENSPRISKIKVPNIQAGFIPKNLGRGYDLGVQEAKYNNLQ